ncbi:MAG: tape measure protein [bacterium]|nr:tape measure protein [bacterium]
MADNELNILIKLKDMFSKSADKVDKSIKKIGTDSTKASKGVKDLNKQTSSMSKSIGNLIKGGALAAVAKGIFNIGKNAIGAAADLEQQIVAFEVMLGSAEAAKSLMQEINKVAVSTPFEQADIIDSTKKLLAFGIAEDVVIKKFKMLGDASQGNKQKLDSLTRAYGKVSAKGKVSMEEINMVTEAGVPILDAMAESLDTTKEEVIKLSGQGRLMAKDFDAAFQTMTSEGGIFYQSMIKQSKTMGGLMSTMSGNFSLVSQELGKALLPIAKKVAIAINKIVGAFLGMSDGAKQTIGIIVAVAGTLTLLTTGFFAVSAAAAAMGIAINAATLGIPLAIGAIVAGVVMLVQNFDKLKDGVTTVFGDIRIAMNNVLIGVLEFVTKMTDVLNKLPGVNIDTEGAIENLNKLNEKIAEQKEKRISDNEELASMEDEKNASSLERETAHLENMQALRDEFSAVEIETDLEKTEAKKERLEEWYIYEQERLIGQEEALAELNATYAEQKALLRESEVQASIAASEKEYIKNKAIRERQVKDAIGFSKIEMKWNKARAEDFDSWENFMLNAKDSKSKELVAIAKALAIKNIIFDTGKAAMAAYSSLAPIPFVGPVLGAAAAGAAIAFGAEQIQTVQSGGSFASGGVVGATMGADNTQINAREGEMVLNADQQGELFDVAQGGGAGGDLNIAVNIDGQAMMSSTITNYNEAKKSGTLEVDFQ